MIPADRFYAAPGAPPQQGDILLAGVARLVAEDRFTPPRWRQLDAIDVTAPPVGPMPSELRIAAGPALVMVTSHDCHFDKEWNSRREALLKDGVTEEDADRIANDDESLDRTFTASPLLRPDDVILDRGNLMAGRIVGYLPVPAAPDGLVPEAVVDLTYRVTLDRLDIVRVAVVSSEARAQLRYALARVDALRASTVGFELEAVVGRSIQQVTIPRDNPLLVRLHLDDGATIDLLQQPVDPSDAHARVAPRGAS